MSGTVINLGNNLSVSSINGLYWTDSQEAINASAPQAAAILALGSAVVSLAFAAYDACGSEVFGAATLFLVGDTSQLGVLVSCAMMSLDSGGPGGEMEY